MKPIKIKISAFGPFAGEMPEIRFDQFEGEGLFLISGKTGAGKTTIFDAICYALYGQTSGSYRDNKNLSSEYADPGTESYVDFYFSHQGKSYHVRRSPAHERKKVRGEGTTMEPENASFYEEDKAPVEGIRQVNKAVEELLRINFDQFKQIVMIPQNEFKEMLNASTDDRTKILRKIFMTEKYDDVAGKLKNRMDVINETKRDTEKSILHHFREVTAEKESESATELEEMQKNANETQSAWNIDDIIRLTERIIFDDTEKSKAVKDQLEKTEEELNSHKTQLATARLNNGFIEKYENLKKEKEQLDEKKEEIEQLREIVPRQKAAAYKVAPVHAGLSSKTEEKDRSKRRIEEGEKRLQELMKAAQLAVAELEAAGSKREEAEALKRSSEKISEDKERYQKRDGLIEQITGMEEQQSKLMERQKDIKDKESDLEERIGEYLEIIEDLKDSPEELAAVSDDESKMRFLLSTLEKITGQLADTWREHRDTLKEKQQQFEAARIRFELAEGEKKQAERLYENDKAGLLASKLIEGEKCPVCGSTHHPEPAELADDSISEEKLNELREKEEKIRKEKEAAFVAAESQKAALEGIENNIRSEAETYFADYLLAIKANEGSLDDDLGDEGAASGAASRDAGTAAEGTSRDSDAADVPEDVAEIIEKARRYQNAAAPQLKELTERRKALEKSCERLDKTRGLERKAQGEEAGHLRKEKEHISKQLGNLDVELAKAKTSLEENQDLKFEDWDAAKKEMEFQKRKSEKLLDAIINAEEAKKSADTAVTDKGSEIRTLKEGLKKTAEEEQLLKEKVDSLLAENGFADMGEYDRFNVTEETISLNEQSIRVYDDRVISNSAQLAQAEKDAKGRTHIDIDSLAEKSDQKQSEVDELRSELGDIRTRIKINWEKNAAIKSLGPEYEKAKKESNTLLSLYKLVSGQTGNGKITLEQYVQVAGFDRILLAANRRLGPISDERFQLFRREDSLGKRINTSLDLEVLDNYTGHRRPVGNLSGGESFKASLSLALGLSDTVSSDMGGVQMDALFIDEGFGSLDSESIESAMDILLNLSSSNKLVGIISHREELKESIPRQIRVNKTREGSTVEIDCGM